MTIVERLATLALALASVAAQAAGEGTSFSRKDWVLSCDNTRTCRAAGYNALGVDGEPVSVLLTREAGPHTEVQGELTLGSTARESFPKDVELRIDGRGIGRVELDQEHGVLSAAQVDALLRVLPLTGTIVFAAGKEQWRLSGDGAAAVLLKIDEVQGRIGTPGALVRKGTRREDAVLPPLAAPVIQIPGLAPAQPGDEAIARRIRPALSKFSEECEGVAEKRGPVQVWRLSATRLLVAAECWLAAYNSGTGYWVANDKPPYNPHLVTADGSEYDGKGRISMVQKGRGRGDCVATREWAWNGAAFVPSLVQDTGPCRGVAGGGPWELPTLATDVRTDAPQQKTP